MAFYESEKQAAWFALNELRSKLPELNELDIYLPESSKKNIKEWGTTIYKITDSDGGNWYSYHVPYEGEATHWEPFIKPPQGATDVSFCHTHPNDAPFSKRDRTTARGKDSLGDLRCNFYMVTQSGGYCYDGKIEDRLLIEDSLQRVITLWGLPYPSLCKKYYNK